MFFLKRILARILGLRVCYYCEQFKKLSDIAFMLHYQLMEPGICQDCAAEGYSPNSGHKRARP